jgi:uncharacterized protein (TIGR00369 family)
MSQSRSKTIQWQDPALCAAGAKGRSGLEFLRAMIAGQVPPPPITETLGFSLVSVEQGFARFEGLAAEFHYNPLGTVHGGVACTLLDSALGCAVMTTLDAETGYTTAQIAVHLTRPITVATGRMIAEAKVVHRGGRVATAEGRLTDDDGKLLAHATTTCVIFPRAG